jgi:hypothetical protein
MKLQRPSSALFRGLLAALGLWISFACAFVIFGRIQPSNDWTSLSDLFLLAVAVPVGVSALGFGLWLIGKRGTILIAIALSSLSVLALAVWFALAIRESNASAERRGLEDRSRQQLELRHERVCGPLRGSDNPFDHSVCVRVEEQKRLDQIRQQDAK